MKIFIIYKSCIPLFVQNFYNFIDYFSLPIFSGPMQNCLADFVSWIKISSICYERCENFLAFYVIKRYRLVLNWYLNLLSWLTFCLPDYLTIALDSCIQNCNDICKSFVIDWDNLINTLCMKCNNKFNPTFFWSDAPMFWAYISVIIQKCLHNFWST